MVVHCSLHSSSLLSPARLRKLSLVGATPTHKTPSTWQVPSRSPPIDCRRPAPVLALIDGPRNTRLEHRFGRLRSRRQSGQLWSDRARLGYRAPRIARAYRRRSAAARSWEINAPALRSFALLGIRWAEAYQDGESDLARTLSEAKWPNLESFEIRIPETFTCSVPDNDGAYVRCARYDEDHYEDEGGGDGYTEGVD